MSFQSRSFRGIHFNPVRARLKIVKIACASECKAFQQAAEKLPRICDVAGVALQELLSEIFEFIPLPVLIICPKTSRILFKNHLVQPFFGVSESNCLEHLESHYFSNISTYTNLITQFQKGQTLINSELEFKKAWGESFKAQVSAKCINYQNQRATFLILNDNREQQSLQQLNRLLATAVHYISDAIEITNAQSKIEYVNPAFETVTGYSQAEVIGKTPDECLPSSQHPDDFYQTVHQAATRGQVWNSCLISQRKNGTLLHQELTSSPVYNKTGTITHFVTVRRDLTQHQQAEAEWQKFVALVENSSDFIAMSSLEGKILYVNEAGRQLVGLGNLEEALSKSMSDYLPEDDLECFFTQTLPALQTVGRHEGEGRLRHFQTGECFEMHRSCFVVKHSQTNEVLCLATVQRDIRKLKQAELSLKSYAQKQAAVAQLGQRALAGIELPTLLTEATSLVAQVLNLQLSGIWQLKPETESLTLQTGVGWQSEFLGVATLKAKLQSHAGYTFLTSEPVIVRDFRTDRRFKYSPLLRHHQIISGVSVAIPGQSHPFGVLVGYTTTHRQFTEDDQHFLQAIANVLASTIERHQTESRLRLLERAITASSNGIVLADALQSDFPIIYVNPAFEAMTGYQATEVIGRNCRFLQGQEIHQSGLAEVRNALKQKKECHVTLRNYRKDGTSFWNELRIAPVFDADGALTHFVGIQTDITQNKQAEAALREREEQYRRIVETATEGIWVLNQEGQTNFVNQQMANMLGYSIDEMLGEPLYSFMPKEGIALAKEYLQRRRQGVSEVYDYQFCRKDGSTLWVIVSAAPLFDGQGNYAGALKMITNITDRKLAEAALRESEQRLDGILASLEDVVWSISVDNFQTLYLNSAVDKIYGRPRFEFFENSHLWLEVIHPDDQGRVSNSIPILMATGNQELEYRIIRPDGEVRWLCNRSHLIRNSSGKAVRIEGIATDITERKCMEERLKYEAFYDALTGLPNRTLFIDRLEQAMTRAKRQREQFAVLFLDLDRFKVVNDSLGHLVGDQLLIAIAQRLKTCLRPEDTVARLGGDEFTILLNHIQTKDEVTNIAERIHEVLKSPFNLSGYEVFTSASIGIALSSTNYKKPIDLLRDADAALYHAKERGKAWHTVFDPSMYDRAVTLLQLETDLRRAIERQELRVYYQPIVSLSTGHISGFEALVRWQHPERGLISPTEFIPISEEMGLIIPISQWVLQEACQHLRTWQEKFPNHSPLTINVNLSGRQFCQLDLVEQITQILQESSLSAHSLKLEITESALMGNPETAATVLQQLRSLGIQLCIDDFGTGYSSLAYLHRFPIDILKIDRSFISRIDHDHEQLAIVRAIITLACNLGMGVVAEGVETIKQVSQLQALRCEEAQGYFFSKPLNQKATEMLMLTKQKF